MQNQAAVEALYSATFVEDYLDTVENLPNELQRHLSSLRELDLVLHRDFLSQLDSLLESFENETSASGQRNILQKIKKGLILAQDIGDEKLVLAQAMADTIENRTRLLEHDAKNLDFGDDDEEENTRPQNGFTPRGSGSNNSMPNVTSSGNKHPGPGSGARPGKRTADDKPDKPVKRRKKQQHQQSQDKHSKEIQDDEESASSSPATGKGNAPGNTKSRGGTASGAGTGATRKPTTKRKQTRKAQDKAEKEDSDQDIDPNLLDIDPDEPTYCLCDQVSYGDMIGCDNDLCPIEWFHFQCVNLSNKPKGKWFCPKCRGDKPTVMKPKAQLARELEKFNKEKEEKMVKQNG